MRNLETGVTITSTGRVTMTAQMNPRMVALLAGELPVEDLDDMELAKGMCRNESGQFSKKVPNLVPRALVQRMQKELYERSDERLREGLISAVETMMKIMQDPEVGPNDRLKAATWLFERLRGKTPEVVEVTQNKPYEEVLAGVKRGPRPVATPHPTPITRAKRGKVTSSTTPDV